MRGHKVLICPIIESVSLRLGLSANTSLTVPPALTTVEISQFKGYAILMRLALFRLIITALFLTCWHHFIPFIFMFQKRQQLLDIFKGVLSFPALLINNVKHASGVLTAHPL